MFKNNVGTVDRVIRVVLGIALIVGFFLNSGGAWSWLYWLGLIPLVTGLFGTCPLYSIFKISTKK